MPSKRWLLALGLLLGVVAPAGAQVTEGVLSVTQTHMS
jgi:hypothetical protein